ncbi:Uncharacterised protein [uncultured archaeon]|nr:Uncharacterised protein [uncultured archaeon]
MIDAGSPEIGCMIYRELFDEVIDYIILFGHLSIKEDSYLPATEKLLLEIGASFILMASNFLELPSFSVILR